MRKRIITLFFALSVVFGMVQYSFADRRSYVWTYEYQTMPRGMTEFEYYLTTEVPDANKSSTNTWKHWAELEYGITDHWDISMYQMWEQSNSASSSTSQYDGFKLRTRYRFGEKDRYFLDPMVYFEYIRDDDLSKPHVGEAKLILAKDIDDWNISYNQVIKRNLERSGKTEHEYALGVGYAVVPTFKLGLESKGNYSSGKYAVGPAASFAANKFWVSFGAMFGLNDKTDDVQTRMIVGIPF
ncbi:MAG: hypothetical protein PHO42_05435 [Candidatus Omnitrophica bacterium]|nr:hypothetical protein [Candidatus Omnitrophota bacterium]